MPTTSDQDDLARELRYVPLEVEVQLDHLGLWSRDRGLVRL